MLFHLGLGGDPDLVFHPRMYATTRLSLTMQAGPVPDSTRLDVQSDGLWMDNTTASYRINNYLRPYIEDPTDGLAAQLESMLNGWMIVPVFYTSQIHQQAPRVVGCTFADNPEVGLDDCAFAVDAAKQEPRSTLTLNTNSYFRGGERGCFPISQLPLPYVVPAASPDGQPIIADPAIQAAAGLRYTGVCGSRMQPIRVNRLPTSVEFVLFEDEPTDIVTRPSVAERRNMEFVKGPVTQMLRNLRNAFQSLQVPGIEFSASCGDQRRAALTRTDRLAETGSMASFETTSCRCTGAECDSMNVVVNATRMCRTATRTELP